MLAYFPCLMSIFLVKFQLLILSTSKKAHVLTGFGCAIISQGCGMCQKQISNAQKNGVGEQIVCEQFLGRQVLSVISGHIFHPTPLLLIFLRKISLILLRLLLTLTQAQVWPAGTTGKEYRSSGRPPNRLSLTHNPPLPFSFSPHGSRRIVLIMFLPRIFILLFQTFFGIFHQQFI